MKKAFVIAVKAVFGVAKVVLAILGVLVLAVVASLLLSIPGGKRFNHICFIHCSRLCGMHAL